MVASDVTADGTWVALTRTPSFTADALVWLLGPADTAVDLVKIPKSNESGLLSLSRLGDRLLSVGRGKAWSSADGSTWKPAKVKLKGLFPTLSGSTGDRVAVLAETMSDELVVLTTTDGKTFTKVTIAPPEGGRLRSEQVAISPMGSIAVAGVDGDLNPHLWSSADGTTVTEAVLPFDAAPYNSIRALHAVPGGPGRRPKQPSWPGRT